MKTIRDNFIVGLHPVLPLGALLRSQLQRPHHPDPMLGAFKPSPNPTQILLRSIHDGRDKQPNYGATEKYGIPTSKMKGQSRSDARFLAEKENENEISKKAEKKEKIEVKEKAENKKENQPHLPSRWEKQAAENMRFTLCEEQCAFCEQVREVRKRKEQVKMEEEKAREREKEKEREREEEKERERKEERQREEKERVRELQREKEKGVKGEEEKALVEWTEGGEKVAEVQSEEKRMGADEKDEGKDKAMQKEKVKELDGSMNMFSLADNVELEKERNRESLKKTKEPIDPTLGDTKLEAIADSLEFATKGSQVTLDLTEINAKLAKVQAHITLKSAVAESVKEVVEDWSTGLSTRLAELKSLIEMPGQEPKPKLLEEFERTVVKLYRADVDNVAQAVERAFQLASMKKIKGLENVADKIGRVYNEVNGLSTRTGNIDTSIADVLKDMKRIVGDIGETVETLLVNQDKEVTQIYKFLATMIQMVTDKANILERLIDMCAKPEPATKDIENATQQLKYLVRTVEAELGEIKETAVFLELKIKGFDGKIEKSTEKVENLGESMQQNMGNLANLIADHNYEQKNIQGSIREMESWMKTKLCSIEEACLVREEKPVPTEPAEGQIKKVSRRKWDYIEYCNTAQVVIVAILLAYLLWKISSAIEQIQNKKVEDTALATTATKATEEKGNGHGEELKDKKPWSIWAQ
ncbi:hypothetical protein EV426DRAFT_640969 [Tirmania nivea]|nr:hypothetical protein EV426DRAFT_640969 [Tirmania nivea]